MSRISTTGLTIAEVDQNISDVFCKREGFEDSLEYAEPVSVNTWDSDSIFQLKLTPDFTSSALTHDEVVRGQSSDKF